MAPQRAHPRGRAWRPSCRSPTTLSQHGAPSARCDASPAAAVPASAGSHAPWPISTTFPTSRPSTSRWRRCSARTCRERRPRQGRRRDAGLSSRHDARSAAGAAAGRRRSGGRPRARPVRRLRPGDPRADRPRPGVGSSSRALLARPRRAHRGGSPARAAWHACLDRRRRRLSDRRRRARSTRGAPRRGCRGGRARRRPRAPSSGLAPRHRTASPTHASSARPSAPRASRS